MYHGTVARNKGNEDCFKTNGHRSRGTAIRKSIKNQSRKSVITIITFLQRTLIAFEGSLFIL